MINQKLLFHVVIHEKKLRQFVAANDEVILLEYLHYWCRQQGLRLIVCSVQPDHVHLLVEQCYELALQKTISRLVTELWEWSVIKPTDGFARGNHGDRSQLCYALFTVSFAMLDRLTRFIKHQNQHHETVSFEEEFVSLLDKHDVDRWKLSVHQETQTVTQTDSNISPSDGLSSKQPCCRRVSAH